MLFQYNILFLYVGSECNSKVADFAERIAAKTLSYKQNVLIAPFAASFPFSRDADSRRS